MEIKVDVAGRLHEHVMFETEISGLYADAGDYIRDLIRRHMERVDQSLEAVKAELQRAFTAPESSYVTMTADDVLARHKLRR